MRCLKLLAAAFAAVFRGVIFASAVLGFLLLGSSTSRAAAASQQASSSAPPASAKPDSRTVLSRSLGEAQAPPLSPAAPAAIVRPAPKEPVTDAERQGIAFLSYDFEVHLQPKQQAMAVRARMTLRNDGNQPLARLPLQISSSLAWTDIRIGERPVSFAEDLIRSDADHTGSLREAVITLPHPLASGQTLAVDVTYQGAIAQSSHRLKQIGAPPDVADRSDWDRIGEDFVGLRGFGNVVWYPVVSVPVALGDGDKLFTEVAGQRLRQSGAMISMEVTEEFFGQAPNLAVLDGQPLVLTPLSLPQSANLPGIVTATLAKTRLGFATPSLFVLTRVENGDEGLQVFTTPENSANAQSFLTAATMVAPLISQWLGAKPRRMLTIVDLPEPGDDSYEDGAVLFTGIGSADPKQLTGMLIHSMAHAHFESPYPWLNEGVANFMGTLWLEQTSGREAAITRMDNERGALSLAEPGDPAFHPGESLIAAKDPIYYRTKATYVFWMLRGLAGDDRLAQAFREYDPAEDAAGTEFERILEQVSGKDLKWFFADWVYYDRGLPDFSIAEVYSNSSSLPGSYIVSVTVANSGDTAAEVPVSVRSRSATVMARLRVEAKSRITHRFLLAGEPVEAAVNDGTVPEAEASVHRRSISVQR